MHGVIIHTACYPDASASYSYRWPESAISTQLSTTNGAPFPLTWPPHEKPTSSIQAPNQMVNLFSFSEQHFPLWAGGCSIAPAGI